MAKEFIGIASNEYLTHRSYGEFVSTSEIVLIVSEVEHSIGLDGGVDRRRTAESIRFHVSGESIGALIERLAVIAEDMKRLGDVFKIKSGETK